jgi:hypothetical protein
MSEDRTECEGTGKGNVACCGKMSQKRRLNIIRQKLNGFNSICRIVATSLQMNF